MADERRPPRKGRESRKYRRYHPQYSGQGGGYGHSYLGLNYEGTRPPEDGPYRVPPSREGGGYHHGPYAAQRYHGFSEREPGGFVDRLLQRWPDLPDYSGRGPRNHTRSDARIEEDVAQRLTDSNALDASDIDLTVQNGVVVLDGSVGDRQDKRLAEDLAESVRGVRGVQNNLRLQRTSGQPWQSG